MIKEKQNKRVLIISYYWPPSSGIAVQRNLKLSKYLRNFGWEPVILAPLEADYPGLDSTNMKDLVENLEVLKVKIWEPYKIYRKFTGKPRDANVNNVFYTNEKKTGFTHRLSVWIRSNFFIPDARCMWIKPSVNFLIEYLKENPVDAIFSDGPPHTNTRIACLIKQKTGIPWLADFQDPWSQVDYYQLLSLTPWADQKHKRLEQDAFKFADKITIVSDSWKNDLQKIGAKNVSVIPWGFDPDDFNNLNKFNGEKFTITHAGILGYDRMPEDFLKVISKMCSTVPSFKELCIVRLIGQVDHSIKELIEILNLSKIVELIESVDRSTSLNFMSTSAINLLLLNQQNNAKGRIPGKLFEYLATKRPIICLGDPTGDSATIITKSDAGFAIEYNDQDKISKTLTLLWNNFLSGELLKPMNSKSDMYSNYFTTQKFAKYLDELIIDKMK